MTPISVYALALSVALGAHHKRKKAKPAPDVPAAAPAPAPTPPPTPTPAPTPEVKEAPKNHWSIVILDLADRGAGKDLTDLVSQEVLDEAHKLDGPKVVGSSEIRTVLGVERQKQLMGCSESSCMAEVAGALGADRVLSGSVGKVGDTWVISLSVVNSLSAKLIAQAQRRIEGGNGQDFLDAIGPMFEQLFPDVPLKPGETRGAPAALRAQAADVRIGHADRRFAWAMAGTAGALLAGGVVCGLLAKSAENNFNQLNSQALTTPINFADVRSQQSKAKTLAITTDALFIAGGVAAITSGVLFAFSGGSSAPAKSVEVDPKVSSATVVPVPGGATVALGGSF